MPRVDPTRAADQHADAFVRGDAAWRVQLQSDAEGFDTTVAEFEDILSSWIFR